MTHSNTDELLLALMAQVKHLEQLIQDQGTVGLTHGRRFIYIQNTKRSLWNFIADDEPVNAVALTGYITDLYRKDDEIPKLHVVVRTREEEFVLCSGFETHFSRDVMAAIAQLTPAQAHRPLKIIPCLKEIKTRNASLDQSIKKPVYANVLLDEQTLYTHKLKQQFSADELYVKAREVITGQPETSAEGRHPIAQGTEPVSMMRSSNTTPTSPQSSTAPASESVDWKAFCQQYGIFPGVLKSLAQELGLPLGKLNPRQSALLYQQAYSRFVGVA